MQLPYHQKMDCPLLLPCYVLHMKQSAEHKENQSSIPWPSVLSLAALPEAESMMFSPNLVESTDFSLHNTTDPCSITTQGEARQQTPPWANSLCKDGYRGKLFSPELFHISDYSQQQKKLHRESPTAIPSMQQKQDK